MIGALGDGTLYLQFHDDLSASSYIWLVEHLLRRYGIVDIIADNTGALTSKEMRKCLDYMDGVVGDTTPAAPHPTAQPHRGRVEGDKGGHRRHLL